MRIPAIVLAVFTGLLVRVVDAAVEPVVKNGGFENAALDGAPVGWHVQGRSARVGVAQRPFWRRLSRRFNTGEYRRLRIYVRLQFEKGTVWFDNVSLSGIPVKDPSFEKAAGDRFSAWGQDNIGQTVFCDRSGVGRTGQACVRFSHTESKRMSRAWQDVPCRPHQDVTFAVWARGEPPAGKVSMNAYAEVYGIREDGELGPYWSTSRYSLQTDPESGLGRSALELRVEKKGEVTVFQDVTVPWTGRATLECGVMPADCADGVFQLTVTDAASGKQSRASRPVSGQSTSWLSQALLFRVPPNGKVRVGMRLTGPANLVRVDAVRVKPFSPPFPVQHFQRRPQARELVWKKGCLPKVSGLPHSPDVSRAWAMFAESLGASSSNSSSQPQVPEVQLSVGPDALPDDIPGEEAYRLRVSADGVEVFARTPFGVRWALMTLMDIGGAEGPEWRAPACEVRDWPDLSFRATYRAAIPWDTAERTQLCKRLLRIKMNGLVMEDNNFFRMTNEDIARKTAAVFDDLRAWGIEPIPEMQSFGHAGTQITHDPRLAEGKWIAKERLVLHGLKPTPLAGRNVIRTDATDVALRGLDGTTRYTLGKDYAVRDGTIVYRHPDKAQAFAVHRLPGSRIPDGATVLASYDVVAKGGSYCPSEPGVYAFCLPQLQAVIRVLHPRYVHIGHDEPTRMNADSRCRRRGLTETALIAEDLCRWDNAAHEVDPDVRLMMWADPLNPFHNGKRVLAEPDAFKRVPKDIIQCVWFYGSRDPLTRGLKSLEFFSGHGISTTGSPWYNRACAVNWGRAARGAVQRKWPFIGLLYTSWHRRWDALSPTAGAAWKMPAPDSEHTGK